MSQTVLTFLTALVGTGGFAAILQTFRWYRDRKDDPVQQGLIDVSKIYENLQRLRSTTDASRAMLLKLHNGGGRPQVGNVMYSSILYETYSDHEDSIAPNWQSERIDNDTQYREMLLKMMDGTTTVIKTSDLPECKLKDTYVTSNIKRALIRDVGVKKNDHYYITLTFENEDGNSHLENDTLRVCANRIKQVFNCD